MYPNLFRWLREDESALNLDLVSDDETGWEGWELTVNNPDGVETLSLDGEELLVFHGADPADVMAKAERHFVGHYRNQPV